MSTFDARIRLPGQTRLPLNVVVDITDDRISFIKDEKPLGAWPLAEVEVDFRADGFYIRLEQEEIALSVTDVDGFAGALGLGRRPPVTDGRGGNGAAPPAEPNGRGISSRLHRISPEEQLGDLRQRISELAADITNESIAPPEVFGQWLRLLKELNVRHGQGAIPTALFYRLNTELLDLIPAPRREPHPELQTVGVGPRL